MTEELRRFKDRKTDSYAAVPETKEQATIAGVNREAVSELAFDSAKTVERYLRQQAPNGQEASIGVVMGKSKEGKDISATITNFKPGGSLLRVKIIEDDLPQADFIYKGLLGRGSKDSWATSVIEEEPYASGPEIQEKDPSGRGDHVRDIHFAEVVPNQPFYDGLKTVVFDQGSMDFLVTTQALAIAANQIETENAQRAA